MADNMQVTPGEGVTVALDDVSGVFYQRVKLAYGSDGSAVDVNDANPFPVRDLPMTSGGLSTYRSLDVSGGSVVKSSPGQLYGYFIANQSTSSRYLKLYNKGTAPSSSDTPMMTMPLAGGVAANQHFDKGILFSSGISVRATQLLADNDATAPSGNDVVVNFFFK